MSELFVKTFSDCAPHQSNPFLKKYAILLCTFSRFDLLKLTSALHRQDNTFVKKLTLLGRKHRLVNTLRTLRAISAEHRFAFVPNLVPRIRVSLVQQNGRQHRLAITLRIRMVISTEHPFLLVPSPRFPCPAERATWASGLSGPR